MFEYRDRTGSRFQTYKLDAEELWQFGVDRSSPGFDVDAAMDSADKDMSNFNQTAASFYDKNVHCYLVMISKN